MVDSCGWFWWSNRGGNRCFKNFFCGWVRLNIIFCEFLEYVLDYKILFECFSICGRFLISVDCFDSSCLVSWKLVIVDGCIDGYDWCYFVD